MSNQLMETNGAVSMPMMSSLGIFGSKDSFNLAANLAKSFAKSTIIPRDYQGQEANCLIAVDMSTRLGVSPLMVMQQLYVVNGRPAWSAQFLAAMINSSKRFKTPIKYEMGGDENNRSCVAYVIDYNNERLEGPKIDMAMAAAEGWSTKSGSKWKTMPDVMLRYRAVSFFARLHCGDLTMGFSTAEEIVDIEDSYGTSTAERVVHEISENANRIEINVDNATGEIIEESINSDTDTVPNEEIESDESQPGF